MGSLPTPSNVNAVVANPDDPQRVYAAGPAGIVRSDDAGQTWEASSNGIGEATVTALALNPDDPNVLYAATANGDLFQSDDGATTWRRIGT